VTRFALAVCLVLVGFLQPAQADKDKPKPKAATPVKFTCFIHGPNNMTLTLAPKDGKARKIEIIGVGNGAKWTVLIDGADKTPANKSEVEVHPGDTITWKVRQLTHGVVFDNQDTAEALLKFDTKAGQKLEPRKEDKFKTFGKKPWGTMGFKPQPRGKDTVLAVGTVQ